jgi:transcriptional regulator
MYLPAHFEQPDVEAIAGLLAAHPLATLVWQSADGLSAEHLPLLFDRGENDGAHGTLRGHVARANPLWRNAAGQAVMAVFHGPQAYITPSWYATKAATGKVVPTWNYAVVHAHGRLRVHEDSAWLRALVGRLTDTHEAPRQLPWHVHDAPPDYVTQMLGAIVGIEIELTQLVGKWKLGQNRGRADREGVKHGLSSGDAAARALAAAMPADPPQ